MGYLNIVQMYMIPKCNILYFSAELRRLQGDRLEPGQARLDGQAEGGDAGQRLLHQAVRQGHQQAVRRVPGGRIPRPSRAGTQFNRKCFGLSFCLINGLRLHFGSDTLKLPFFDLFLSVQR